MNFNYIYGDLVFSFFSHMCPGNQDASSFFTTDFAYSHIIHFDSVHHTVLYDKTKRELRKIKIVAAGSSLVAQWLRIRLPMQGTWV